MYLDLIVALNFIVNYFLLWLTAFVTEQKTSTARLVAGSLFGAAFILIVAWPTWYPLYTWLGKTLLPLSMILLTFRPRFFGQGLLLLFTFYLCSCTLGGLVLAFSLWGEYPLDFARGIYYLPAPFLYYLLFFSGVLIFFLARGLKPFLVEKFNLSLLSREFEVEIGFCGKNKKLSAYLDTGNMLREPFSGLPVAITNHTVIREMLPPESGRVFGNGGEMNWLLWEKLFAGNDEATKFYLIPYHTLQGKGFLLGFKPEKIRIWKKGRDLGFSQELIMGVQPKQVHPAGEYDVLLPLEIWRSACKQEGLGL
ncbi:MAG: sigma-E processing peptidase SpoIIGA [Firmicutes bacterium]|nr:sigma-E processing peptidase SpoIIGA [Bacillota bacterium]